jgi:multidrug transporter EmrE-like cation transporter
MVYLFFLVGIAFNGFASFVLKLLGDQNGNLASIETLKNPLLYLALFLFGMNVVFYALFLQKVNLAVGYPAFVGGTFAIVLLLSFLILKETLTFPQILGITLIFTGILISVK